MCVRPTRHAQTDTPHPPTNSLYGKPLTEDELRVMIPVVHTNILGNFLMVLGNANAKGVELQQRELADQILSSVDEEMPITEQLAADLKKLWADPGVQAVWAQRSTFQVLDALEYYMTGDTIDRVASAKYLPTQLDVLHARVRTSGIIEERYEIDGVQFTLFDVGGQRNERKKWIHAFDGVTAVIFVAALNEYDQVLYEDGRTQRMAESIKLFDEIANSQWFSKTSIILFLNKSDLFREKLFRIPYRLVGVRNEDFKGPYAEDAGVDKEAAIQAATKHTLDKFLAVKRDTDRELYCHVTCATDRKNVEVVFNACKVRFFSLGAVRGVGRATRD